MKRRAVFLDRDGVLNRAQVRNGKPYAPGRVEEFEILPGVEAACHALRAAGFLLVVVTNQPDVGRGALAPSVLEEMHGLLRRALPLDRIEVCLDASDGSPRRKPLPGMLLDAARALDIDPGASFMVGDRWRDIDCGHAAGCRTILIDRGYTEALRTEPDYRVEDLPAAARLIIGLATGPTTTPAAG